MMRGWRYAADSMGSFRAIRYDVIFLTRNRYSNFFLTETVKGNTCFCAVIVEVKNWKSLIH